jgi:hypothetical protein
MSTSPGSLFLPRVTFTGRASLLALAAGLLAVAAVAAQPADRAAPGANVLHVPHFELDYVTPRVHRTYRPSHLAESYWRPWYATSTNYARDSYSRYVDQLLEGYDFYDVLGTPVGRSWLVYSWTQEQPQARGSNIVKQPYRDVRNQSELGLGGSSGFSAYQRFFNRLVISGDELGSSTYRLMVGDAIFTMFTPLTFYKPRYNGLRLDIAGGRHAATLLLSRPSDPNGAADAFGGATSGNGTNATHLMGGHLDLALGAGARAGLTYVNVHNAHTQLDLNAGNPLTGTLTVLQDQPLRTLWVRLRDDSPEDRANGAVLLSHDIVFTDTSGTEIRGSAVGVRPTIEGGVQRGGALTADGSEQILLQYDLAALDIDGIGSGDLESVRVELDVANDYRVEVASNLQTDGRGSAANTIFLTDRRSPGNVTDRSNTGIIAVDYGLPVANDILGTNWNLPDWHGLSLQGEIALNRQVRRYPNPALDRHHQMTTSAVAGYTHAAWQHGPWMLFGELFSLDDDYRTSYWITDPSGLLYYGTPIPQRYELVDDDDDLDALPEWQRPFQPSSEGIAWPGYDENGDYLNDHNQNANFIPDYEEPFLRYRSDRPELLAGIDMNHNGTIDRFENDEQPDYPYRLDHRGVHVYARALLGPDARLTVGRQDMGLISGDGRTESWYVLALWEGDIAGGRFRLFDHAAVVRDDIPDHLVQWFQPVDARGRMLDVVDDLAARNTWRNAFYADWQTDATRGWQTSHRVRWDWWRQRDDDETLAQREGRRTSGTLGIVNRGHWEIPVGTATLEPRLKSEWRHERPYSRRRAASTSLEEIAALLWSQPLLAERVTVGYFPKYGRQGFRTTLEVGLETSRFWLLDGTRADVEEDHWRWTFVSQVTNRVAYEGYNLVTRTGLRLGGWRFDSGRDQRTNLVFLTITAGLR